MADIGLTEAEVAEVERTWGIVAVKMKQHGISLFLSVFTNFPNIKTFFKQFDGIDVKDLATNPRLKAHGSSFMHGFAALIDNLDDKDTLVAASKDTILRHVKRNIGLKEYEDVLEGLHIYLKETLGSELTSDAANGWKKITDTFLAIVKETLPLQDQMEKEHIHNGDIHSHQEKKHIQNGDIHNHEEKQCIQNGDIHNHEDKQPIQNGGIHSHNGGTGKLQMSNGTSHSPNEEDEFQIQNQQGKEPAELSRSLTDNIYCNIM